jgi:zinc transporter, ZIP family
MGLLGVYVGIIPVAMGMLWMPLVRRAPAGWVRVMLGLTVGLLGFLAFDAALEATELVTGHGSFGGPLVVILGALISYLVPEGIDAWMRRHRNQTGEGRATLPAGRLALLIAAGIGMHNLGEGLAIGSAYAVGSLALGAPLTVAGIITGIAGHVHHRAARAGLTPLRDAARRQAR